jgi:hypothetical protein
VVSGTPSGSRSDGYKTGWTFTPAPHFIDPAWLFGWKTQHRNKDGTHRLKRHKSGRKRFRSQPFLCLATFGFNGGFSDKIYSTSPYPAVTKRRLFCPRNTRNHREKASFFRDGEAVWHVSRSIVQLNCFCVPCVLRGFNRRHSALFQRAPSYACRVPEGRGTRLFRGGHQLFPRTLCLALQKLPNRPGKTDS